MQGKLISVEPSMLAKTSTCNMYIVSFMNMHLLLQKGLYGILVDIGMHILLLELFNTAKEESSDGAQ